MKGLALHAWVGLGRIDHVQAISMMQGFAPGSAMATQLHGSANDNKRYGYDLCWEASAHSTVRLVLLLALTSAVVPLPLLAATTYTRARDCSSAPRIASTQVPKNSCAKPWPGADSPWMAMAHGRPDTSRPPHSRASPSTQVPSSTNYVKIQRLFYACAVHPVPGNHHQPSAQHGVSASQLFPCG